MMASPDPVLGANALRSRSHNRQLVLGQVRAAGRIGRADIARASGLSTQAVSNIIADLLEDGMILERGRRPASRGLPPVQYGINPRGGFALGVEIRPDTVLAALMDLTGHILFSDRRPLPDPGRASVTGTLQAIRSRAIAKTGVDPARVLGAGIVMPGPFGATGIRDSGSELPGWEDTDPRQWFAQALGLPVAVENDANAAAMAERIAGAAKGLDSYAFLYFGTGLGLGVVSQGRLLTGAFGNAGEIGHVPMPGAEGPIPLEDAVSRLSVRRHLARAGIAAESIDDLRRLHDAKDPALEAWLAQTARPLSAAVAMIENLFDPETVILGGAMPDSLIEAMIGKLALQDRSVANRPLRAQPRVQRGTCGRMTATQGAAALALNRLFTPSIAAES
ncbi:MAG: ROK family protein [Paracoccaceae bacterium]